MPFDDGLKRAVSNSVKAIREAFESIDTSLAAVFYPKGFYILTIEDRAIGVPFTESPLCVNLSHEFA